MRSRLATVLSLAAFTLLIGASRSSAQATQTICKDGSKSAVSGRGACASHGGVDGKATEAARKSAEDARKAAKKSADEARKAEKKAEKAEKKAETAPMVKCTDGAMSKPGRGACSGHGGVAKKTAKPKK
jgi:hypothetical protein